MILVNLPRRIFHTTSKQGYRKPPATPFIQNPPPAENEISNDTFGTGIDSPAYRAGSFIHRHPFPGKTSAILPAHPKALFHNRQKSS